MLTDNYWKIRSYIDSHEITTTREVAQMAVAAINCINQGGNEVGLTYGWTDAANVASSNWTMRYGLTCVLSDDSADPSVSDYVMSGDLSSSISNMVTTINTSFIDGSEITTITITGLNSSANTINIRKIGILKNIMYGLNSYNNTALYCDLLIAEQVLDNPVSVPTNKGFSVSFTWTES